MIISPDKVLSGVAEGSDIGGNLAIILGTAGQQVKLPGAANVYAIGFTDNYGAKEDKEVAVIVSGTCLATAAGAISKDAEVAVADVAGKIKTANATGYVVGRALEAATDAGDKIAILINRYYKVFA